MRKFKFIDLFCGIGGFHQAMSQLGGQCVYACDIDEDCRKTYESNYGLRPDRDITKVDATKIPEYDVLCAGFPCQAFSKAGKRLGFQDETNSKKVIDPGYCWIIPSGANTKPVKIAMEGDTLIREVENADWSKEIQVYKKIGVVCMMTNDICSY